jgi:N-acetylmuramic acid 6-phosphate etherase
MTKESQQSLLDSLIGLTTESRDPRLDNLDTLPILERCKLQNEFDHAVATAVGQELEHIAESISIIAESFKKCARLFYIGAGTSGRLGVLDASECPPTFGTDPSMVQGIIAGGNLALTTAVEGVEDDFSAGEESVKDAGITSSDVLVGITASGRTPFVLGAVAKANQIGAKTIGITNNRPSELESICIGPCIAAVVGPEIVAGSTRLKAGTAQKLVLNMLTTQSMIELGKTYGSAMVDVRATNIKLKARAIRMVMEIADVNHNQAAAALEQAGGSAKLAIVLLLKNVDASAAKSLLAQSDGSIRRALTS